MFKNKSARPQPVSPLRGSLLWARGNHDVSWPPPSATGLAPAAGVAISSLERTHPRQQSSGKTVPQKCSRTYHSLLRCQPRSIVHTNLDQVFPRDPHFFARTPFINLSSRIWSVDGHPRSPQHLLTISFTAANIATRFFFFDPISTPQAHFRIPGHERSLTQIKFNKEGDLLFSCSKDHVINVWFSHNGERLGTYDGHNGTVWTIDVDCTFPTVPRSSPINIINRLAQRNPGF